MFSATAKITAVNYIVAQRVSKKEQEKRLGEA